MSEPRQFQRESLSQLLHQLAELAIALLDEMDGDPDREPDPDEDSGDAEPPLVPVAPRLRTVRIASHTAGRRVVRQ